MRRVDRGRRLERGRGLERGRRVAAATFAALVLATTAAWTALADTASNPQPAAGGPDPLLLGGVAIAVLVGVIVLARPRRGPG